MYKRDRWGCNNLVTTVVWRGVCMYISRRIVHRAVAAPSGRSSLATNGMCCDYMHWFQTEEVWYNFVHTSQKSHSYPDVLVTYGYLHQWWNVWITVTFLASVNELISCQTYLATQDFSNVSEVKIEGNVSLFTQITSDLAWFRIRPRRGAWLSIRARSALTSSSVPPTVPSSS